LHKDVDWTIHIHSAVVSASDLMFKSVLDGASNWTEVELEIVTNMWSPLGMSDHSVLMFSYEWNHKRHVAENKFQLDGTVVSFENI